MVTSCLPTSPFSGAPLAARPLQRWVGRRRTLLPLRNVATHHPEQGVRLGSFHCRQPSLPPRIARPEFLHQVMPFEHELTARNSEVAGRSGTTDLLGRKTVTAARRLSVNDPQILGNEAHGEGLLLKPK